MDVIIVRREQRLCFLHFQGFVTMCHVVAVDDNRISSDGVWNVGGWLLAGSSVCGHHG